MYPSATWSQYDASSNRKTDDILNVDDLLLLIAAPSLGQV